MDVSSYLVGRSIKLADEFTTAPYYDSVNGTQTGNLTTNGDGTSKVIAVQGHFTWGKNELWMQLEDYPPVWVVYGDGVYVFDDGTGVQVDQSSIDAMSSFWGNLPGVPQLTSTLKTIGIVLIALVAIFIIISLIRAFKS